MSEKILPIPCTKVEEKTVKDWFLKINEKLDELKAAVLFGATNDNDVYEVPDYYKDLRKNEEFKKLFENIALEASETITAITSMLEAMGIDENMRQEAQKLINEKNRERGRF